MSQVQIFQHVWREFAAILHVVPVQEDRDDQAGGNQAGPERNRVPNLRTGTEKDSVDEREQRAECQQNCRRLERTRDVSVVDAVNPARVKVEEVEDDVAAVRYGEDEEEARRIGSGNRKQCDVEQQVGPHRRRRRTARHRIEQPPASAHRVR